jgi:hypothetical protein
MKKAILAAALFFSVFTLHAQDEEGEKKGFQKERLFFGGNFALAFGTNTVINISPQIGYRFSNLLAAGLGINGQYINQRLIAFNGQEAGRLKLGVLGLNAFGRIYPIEQIMLQVQPEANYIFGSRTIYSSNPQTTKEDPAIVPSLLLGGGYVQPSGRGAFIISIFYDVLQDPKSPYGAQPIYNFGYNISF